MLVHAGDAAGAEEAQRGLGVADSLASRCGPTCTLDTLAGIKSYRGLSEGGKLDFGVYFDVEEPGLVRVGDRVDPLYD